MERAWIAKLGCCAEGALVTGANVFHCFSSLWKEPKKEEKAKPGEGFAVKGANAFERFMTRERNCLASCDKLRGERKLPQ